MIALCLQHHKEADSCAFSNGQLRELKASPFLKRIGAGPAGRFNWRREQVILEAGGGIFVRCPIFLRVQQRPVIWLSSDGSGNQVLNLDIWDSHGQLAMSMRDNDWLVGSGLDDVEAPPSARSLAVRAPSRGFHVSIEFTPITLEQIIDQRIKHAEKAAADQAKRYMSELNRCISEGASDMEIQWYRRLAESSQQGQSDSESDERSARLAASIRRGWSGEEFVCCNLQAQIPFPYQVSITDSEIILPGNNILAGITAIDCNQAIVLG
jgi:hypothetical protein